MQPPVTADAIDEVREYAKARPGSRAGSTQVMQGGSKALPAREWRLDGPGAEESRRPTVTVDRNGKVKEELSRRRRRKSCIPAKPVRRSNGRVIISNDARRQSRARRRSQPADIRHSWVNSLRHAAQSRSRLRDHAGRGALAPRLRHRRHLGGGRCFTRPLRGGSPKCAGELASALVKRGITTDDALNLAIAWRLLP